MESLCYSANKGSDDASDVSTSPTGCPTAALDKRKRAMPACRTLQRQCVETRDGYSCLRKRRKRSAMGTPCERWSSRRVGGWAAGTKLLRDLVTYGGGKWTVQPACCRTMENPAGTSAADCLRGWGPELRSDLLLSLSCCRQSGVCKVSVCLEVFAVRLPCEGPSDRDRDREEAQTTLKQAQQEILEAQQGLHQPMQGSPHMPTGQVPVSTALLFSSLRSLTEQMWISEAGAPPEPVVMATQDSRLLLQATADLAGYSVADYQQAETASFMENECGTVHEGDFDAHIRWHTEPPPNADSGSPKKSSTKVSGASPAKKPKIASTLRWRRQ